MGTSKVVKKESFYDKADKRLHKWAATIGAIIAIVGALTGALGWIHTQFTDAVKAQVEDLKSEMQASDRKTEVQITRLELMTLIDTQPDNVAEIDKVARHYFLDLKADWYMTGIFSKWCREHGGDANIVVGVD